MESYPEHAIGILKAKGYRMTKPRKLVIQILNEAERTLSAHEIKAMLDEAGENVDSVSVYRILECLEENRLVHRVLNTGRVRKCQLEEETHCQLEQPDHCHHFLVCRQCERISEIHCVGLAPMIAQITQTEDFSIEQHNLEFIGLCRSCRDTANRLPA